MANRRRLIVLASTRTPSRSSRSSSSLNVSTLQRPSCAAKAKRTFRRACWTLPPTSDTRVVNVPRPTIWRPATANFVTAASTVTFPLPPLSACAGAASASEARAATPSIRARIPSSSRW
jgi:hypothetical protein